MHKTLALTLVLTVAAAPIWAQHAVGRDGSSGGGGAEGRHSGGGGSSESGASSSGGSMSGTPSYTPSSSISGSSAESRHSRHVSRPRHDPRGLPQDLYRHTDYGSYFGSYYSPYFGSRLGVNPLWPYYWGPLAWGYPFFGWSLAPQMAALDPYYWDSLGWGTYFGPSLGAEDVGNVVEDDGVGSIRLMIEPEDAAVYLDGYYMGDVGAFNGFHQRLRVRPGAHTLSVKREGFRTLRMELDVTASKTVRIRRDLERGVDTEQTQVGALDDVR